jgi:hypothetical protein
MNIFQRLFKSGEKRAGLEDIVGDSSRISTSVTLGYEADRWGVERIALDGVQNHLPADSKGSTVNVDFLVNNEWTPRTDYQNGTVQAIRFSDDGAGYSNELLGIFHSTKKGNADAVGYFGEGLKMLSAATIREGIDMELRSRDWSAKPVPVDLEIEGEQIQKLVYDVKPAERINGSQSIFWNPSQDFVDYVRNLDKKVLLLRDGFTPLYESGKRAIIDTEGDVFVKGVYISSLFKDRLLFSYGLDVVPNRDRDDIHESKLVDELGRIWSGVERTEPIKHLLQVAQNDPSKFESSHELYVLRNYHDRFDGETWQRAFKDLYGDNAVLQTQANVRSIVENLGNRVVDIQNQTLQKILGQLGIAKDVDSMESGDNFLYLSESFDPNRIRKDVKLTSLTLGYRAENWSNLRIVLDALANHMPEDSGGRNVKIEYLLSKRNDDGTTVKEWSERAGYYDHPEAVRIRDDGKGYSLENLLVMHSDKSQEAVGQFGEGLKMLSAACLREKVPVKFRSRDWIAMPMSHQTDIDGKDVQRLGYKTVEEADGVEGSATTFYEPSRDLLEIFGSIGDYVLHFNSHVNVLHEGGEGRIISVGDKKATFVKGFHVADNNSGQFRTLFSYDLQTRNITPDRNFVNYDTLRSGVQSLLETNTNPAVVDRVLEAAKDDKVEYAEFRDLDLDDRAKEIWTQSFERVFGSRTVLDSEDPSSNYEAEHVGYGIAYLDKKVASTLRKAGVRTARHIAFENYDTKKVEDNSLTPEERSNLALIPKIDSILRLESPVQVEVYDQMNDSTGRDPGIAGFWAGEKGKLYLRRSVLSSPYETTRVYTHERGHNETGSPDPADNFRHFFESNLTGFVVRELAERGAPIEINPEAFKYSLALKGAMAAAGRYDTEAETLARQRQSLAEKEAAVEQKVNGQYQDRITALQSDLDRLKADLRTERNMPWYKRLFR